MNNKLPPHFSAQLKYHRTLQRLSQTELERRTGIKRRLISQIEKRERAASMQNACILAAELGFTPGETTIVARTKRANVKNLNKLTIEKGDRPFAVRLVEARRRFKNLQGLEDLALRRPDGGELLAFLHDVVVDSAEEVIALLRLAAGGFDFAYDSPGRFGYFGNKIVDPLRRENVGAQRRPLLYDSELAVFPQVSLDIGRVIRVDWLACRLEANSPQWIVVEFDGEGHRADHSRELLDHPVVRFQTGEILAPSFVADLKNLIHRTTARKAA